MYVSCVELFLFPVLNAIRQHILKLYNMAVALAVALIDKETRKMVRDSQIGRVKENLKLSYGETGQKQAPDTKRQMKALRQDHH